MHTYTYTHVYMGAYAGVAEENGARVQLTANEQGKYDRMHMRHGQGRHIWTNGDWYEGDWRDDKQHGRGIMFFKSSNEVHEGGFANGVPDGQGTR